MHLTERGTTLIVKDTPGCLWLLGLWFLAGGAIALAMPFVAVNRGDVSWWGKVLVAALGVATIAAGVFVICDWCSSGDSRGDRPGSSEGASHDPCAGTDGASRELHVR